MYRSLLTNTAISAIAYFIISVVGVFVVSWQVGAYGLEAYGIITLARLFLPNGLVGVLDLGAADTISHTVAAARVTGSWNKAGASIAAQSILVFSCALVTCLLLALLAPKLAVMLSVDIMRHPEFISALQYSILVLPLTLTGLVAEGVIRGFERYRLARSIEVIASIAYAAGCYALILAKIPYIAVIYLGIGISLLRAAASSLYSWQCLHPFAPQFREWRSVGMPLIWARVKVILLARVLGILQINTIPLFISALVGPTSAGAYDVLMRLPRFAKSALGLLNSAVLPFTSKLEAENRHEDITRLVENGMTFMACLCAPLLFAGATFSKPLLTLWIGHDLAALWIWQSIAFVVPFISILAGLGNSTLFSKIDVYKIFNRLIALRIVVQYSIALLLLQVLEERAFILGSVVAMLVAALWEFRLIFRQHRIGAHVTFQLLHVMGIGFLLMALCLPYASQIDSILLLLLSLSIYTAVFWLLAWIMIVPATTRRSLLAMIPLRTVLSRNN